jgi:hypothetical protein
VLIEAEVEMGVSAVEVRSFRHARLPSGGTNGRRKKVVDFESEVANHVRRQGLRRSTLTRRGRCGYAGCNRDAHACSRTFLALRFVSADIETSSEREAYIAVKVQGWKQTLLFQRR